MGRIGPAEQLWIGAIFAGLSLVAGCDGRATQPGTAASTITIPVKVFEAKKAESVFESSSFFGAVRANHSGWLGFARNGRVQKINVAVGDTLKAGEVVAQLEGVDDGGQAAQLSQALAEAQQELASLGPENELRPGRAESIRERIEQLKAEQKQVELASTNGTVTAPYDCVCAESRVDRGTIVTAGQPVFRVLATGVRNIVGEVSLEFGRELQVGDLAWVVRQGAPLRAKIESLSPDLNPSTRTRRVTLSLPDSAEGIDWLFGEVIEIRIWRETQRTGVWLPLSAMQRQPNGVWCVYVVSQETETVELRSTDVIQSERGAVLVEGGVSEGDRVVVNGTHRIVPGQRVEAIVSELTLQLPAPPGAAE